MKLQAGVKVLIKSKEGLYLLLQRSAPLPDGTGIKWDIPGGRIDPAESLQDALKREVHEEVGLELTTIPDLVKAQDIFIPDIDLHVVRLTYVIDLHGEVTLSDEHQDHKWVTAAEGLKLNVDPYLHEVLDSIRDRLLVRSQKLATTQGGADKPVPDGAPNQASGEW